MENKTSENKKKEFKNFAEFKKIVKHGDIIIVFHEKEKKFKTIQFVKMLNNERAQCINVCNGVVWDIAKKHFDEKVLSHVTISRNEKKVRDYDKAQLQKHFARFAEDRKLYADVIKKFSLKFSEKE